MHNPTNSNQGAFMTKRSRVALISVIVALMGFGTWYFFLTPHDIETFEDAAVGNIFPGTGGNLQLFSVENNAFAAGEKLYYNIIYKGITVGHALVEVREGPLVNDRPTLKYVATAKSTKFFDAFFKVRDESVSTVDRASLFSVAFDQSLHEGRYKAVRNSVFDYRQRRFASAEKRKGEIKNKEGIIVAPFHDVLSALYFVRTRELTPGKDLTLSIFRNNTGKPVPIKIGPELQELKTTLGKVSCLRVEPMIQGDSLFRSKDNKLVVWMTNDKTKLPVVMEATISVGLVRVKLDKWEK